MILVLLDEVPESYYIILYYIILYYIILWEKSCLGSQSRLEGMKKTESLGESFMPKKPK